MLKEIFIILFLLILAYCIVSYFKNTLKNTNSMKRIIHDPKKNKSFFITGYNDNQISEIQLSLNKRNNVYEIKGNNLFKNNSLIQSLILF